MHTSNNYVNPFQSHKNLKENPPQNLQMNVSKICKYIVKIGSKLNSKAPLWKNVYIKTVNNQMILTYMTILEKKSGLFVVGTFYKKAMKLWRNLPIHMKFTY